MHPLAYRDSTNKLPDCSVDAMQWSILNISKETNLIKGEWSASTKEYIRTWSRCHGLEIFNDFTYTNSYNSELQLTPVDNPNFVIPCLNGGTMNIDHNSCQGYYRKLGSQVMCFAALASVGAGVAVESAIPAIQYWLLSPKTCCIGPYTWWFDTYPLEYAEFLLVTALSHGVWLHPLAANDVGYQKGRGIADKMDDFQALKGDPKSSTIEQMGNDEIRKYVREKSAKNKEDISFYKGLPYGTDAAFGFTTLIDSMQELKNIVKKVCDGQHIAADEEYVCNMAETKSLQYLIDGKIYIPVLSFNPLTLI